MTDVNPITVRLAAISGLQTGRRLIAAPERAPVKAKPKAEPEQKPKGWSPERRARHQTMMRALWSDPKMRQKMKQKPPTFPQKIKKARAVRAAKKAGR